MYLVPRSGPILFRCCSFSGACESCVRGAIEGVCDGPHPVHHELPVPLWYQRAERVRDYLSHPQLEWCRVVPARVASQSEKERGAASATVSRKEPQHESQERGRESEEAWREDTSRTIHSSRSRPFLLLSSPFSLLSSLLLLLRVLRLCR